MDPLQVTPAYPAGAAGNCHVHHADGVVAVLVELVNPELAQPLLTRLRQDPTGDGAAAWLAASRAEPLAGAAVGVVDGDGELQVWWWGRIDVQITTPYGFETHTGAEEPRHHTVIESMPVRLVPRATHASAGATLERGTVMAGGCEVTVAPRPAAPDTMPEASSAVVASAVPPDELATAPSEPEPQPERGPVAQPESETDLAAAVAAADAEPVAGAGPAPEPASTPTGVELVRGLRCRNGHHNHPRARLCSLCGDAMQNVSMFVGRDGVLGELGERPPLGILTLDDGQAYQIGHDTVIGRTPNRDDATMVIEFPDDDTMSRAHVAIDLDGWNVFVRDLGSSNGTGARFPNTDGYVRLEPHQRYPLPSTSVLVFGRRWATFTATSAAPVTA